MTRFSTFLGRPLHDYDMKLLPNLAFYADIKAAFKNYKFRKVTYFLAN